MYIDIDNNIQLHYITCLQIAAFLYFAPWDLGPQQPHCELQQIFVCHRYPCLPHQPVYLVSLVNLINLLGLLRLYMFVVFCCCFGFFPASAFMVAAQGTPEPMARVVRSPSWTPGRRTLEIGNVLQETSFWGHVYISYLFIYIYI